MAPRFSSVSIDITRDWLPTCTISAWTVAVESCWLLHRHGLNRLLIAGGLLITPGFFNLVLTCALQLIVAGKVPAGYQDRRVRSDNGLSIQADKRSRRLPVTRTGKQCARRFDAMLTNRLALFMIDNILDLLQRLSGLLKR